MSPTKEKYACLFFFWKFFLFFFIHLFCCKNSLFIGKYTNFYETPTFSSNFKDGVQYLNVSVCRALLPKIYSQCGYAINDSPFKLLNIMEYQFIVKRSYAIYMFYQLFYMG